MTPKRLLPYILIFLALASSYAILRWTETRREAQEQKAKKIFQVKEADIDELALRQGKNEIRLVKKDHQWSISKPMEARADQEAVASMLTTLTHLARERDLGAGEDPKTFGLDKPDFILEFTAAGKSHRLRVGSQAPGDQAYYGLKDQEPQVFLINAGDKDSLDRRLPNLRDRTLFTFSPDKVKALKLIIEGKSVTLEKAGPQIWRQVGRETTPIRGDRVEGLLRHLNIARVKDFAAEAPQDVRPFGLSPKPSSEISVVLEQGQETLFLGAKTANGFYARKGTEGPVVVVDQNLMRQITRVLGSLEDRRLWSGPVTEVQKVVWGPPPKTWTALKDKDFWKITGPDGRVLRQPGVRLEIGLFRLTELQHQRVLPGVSTPAQGVVYLLEAYDGAGKLLFRLEEMGSPKADAGVEVRTQVGHKTTVALVSRKEYTDWQGEMERLTTPPAKED